MNQDIELFVQAFWVKCREVIRPEIDAAIDALRHAGRNANVSTQEFAASADGLPAPAGPSVTLAVRPAGTALGTVHPAIEFHGDVACQAIDVLADGRRIRSYELAALGAAEVKAEIEDWLARPAADVAV